MEANQVVDASAVAALLFGEPEAQAVGDRLSGARLVAPVVLSFELANVCLVKCRRHPEQKASLRKAFALRRALGIEEIPVDHDEAAALALQTGLTSYDASYLWLARRLAADLVTLDRQLAKASAKS